MFLEKDQTQVSLTQVGVWFIGEYGEELLESYYDQARQQQLDAVSEEAVLDLLGSILSNVEIDNTTKSRKMRGIAYSSNHILSCTPYTHS